MIMWIIVIKQLFDQEKDQNDLKHIFSIKKNLQSLCSQYNTNYKI